MELNSGISVFVSISSKEQREKNKRSD